VGENCRLAAAPAYVASRPGCSPAVPRSKYPNHFSKAFKCVYHNEQLSGHNPGTVAADDRTRTDAVTPVYLPPLICCDLHVGEGVKILDTKKDVLYIYFKHTLSGCDLLYFIPFRLVISELLVSLITIWNA
jgi:hypothetical protein